MIVEMGELGKASPPHNDCSADRGGLLRLVTQLLDQEKRPASDLLRCESCPIVSGLSCPACRNRTDDLFITSEARHFGPHCDRDIGESRACS